MACKVIYLSPRSAAWFAGMQTMSNRQLQGRRIRRPCFHRRLRYLRNALVPLVSATTKRWHPDFPRNIFAYNLLTSTQLDGLARHYHQDIVDYWQRPSYPKQVPSWVGNVHITTKRRRFGRFIGLQGCESPVDAREGPMEMKMSMKLAGLLNGIESAWSKGGTTGKELNAKYP
jgi:hypothetical protein